MLRVQAEVAGPLPDPMFQSEGDEGLVDRFMLWCANRLIRRGAERGSRRRSGSPRCHLEVWQVDGDDEELAHEETCAGMEEGCLRSAEIVSSIRAGALRT